MSELAVLRIVGLKGRVAIDDLASSLGRPVEEVRELVGVATDLGHLKEMPTGLKVTPEGRERLAVLLADERADIDQAAMHAIYEDFTPVNADAKAIFTQWQVRPSGEPNDHTDAAYDGAVLDRLTAVHERILTIVARAAELAPRAGRYAERLSAAQQKYAAGESAYVTRPVIDSYHTVWFELHEDLISWSGLTRAEEAAAGRAS